jgi:outer membrane lipoprotein-sorting protein
MRSAPGSVKTDTLNPQQGGQKMHTKSKLFLFVFFAGLITMATFCGTAGASEFLADVVMKGGMMSGDGKLWVKNNKSRQEMGAGAEKMIIIMDLDQGFQWMLMPDMKMCMKTKLQAKGKGFRPENFVGTQQGPMEAQLKRLGTETVNGYKCDKYLLTFKNKKMGTMIQWFATKLSYPVKIVNKSDMTGEVITELQNIQKTSVKDDLFIVPSGYQEMPSPQIPQMPAKKQ